MIEIRSIGIDDAMNVLVYVYDNYHHQQQHQSSYWRRDQMQNEHDVIVLRHRPLGVAVRPIIGIRRVRLKHNVHKEARR